jgi:hypothetical protein
VLPVWEKKFESPGACRALLCARGPRVVLRHGHLLFQFALVFARRDQIEWMLKTVKALTAPQATHWAASIGGWFRDSPKGLTFQRNTGVANVHPSCELICFLEDDVKLHRNYLRNLANS